MAAPPETRQLEGDRTPDQTTKRRRIMAKRAGLHEIYADEPGKWSVTPRGELPLVGPPSAPPSAVPATAKTPLKLTGPPSRKSTEAEVMLMFPGVPDAGKTFPTMRIATVGGKMHGVASWKIYTDTKKVRVEAPEGRPA